MQHRARFALNLFAPVLIASVLLASGVALIEQNTTEFGLIYICIFYGYFFAGLPSLAHACFMHWRYRHGLDPRSRRAWGLMTLSGLCAGCLIGGFFAYAADPRMLLIFAMLGAATGTINALLHRLVSNHPREG
ncbi:MAG: hypothetical protein RIQ79_2687 [Verrucomicrobiota bacterium]